MKQLAVIVWLCSACMALAIPGPRISLKELSGKVVHGTWVGATKIHYAQIPEKGEEKFVKSQSSPPMVFLVLEKPKGLTEEQRKEFNAGFSSYLRQMMVRFSIPDEIAERLKPEGDCLLWIAPCEKLGELKVGSTVRFREINYMADEYGGSCNHKGMEVVPASE